MDKVKLVSNLFLMKILAKLDMLVYPVEIYPKPAENIAHVRVMKQAARQINQIFYPFALAG